MKVVKFTSFLLLTCASTLVASSAIPADVEGTCGTCNPSPGQNHCDITTSCINTGTKFHCACRAGYKASQKNDDVSQQFRLSMPHYQFLVFVPGNTVCNTLCDNPWGGIPTLCSEVEIEPESECPV